MVRLSPLKGFQWAQWAAYKVSVLLFQCVYNVSNAIKHLNVTTATSDHLFTLFSLRGDKVSMLTHIYPHKPLRKIEVTICNHQADSPLCVWPDVWSGDLQVLKMHGHTWRRMSLLRQGVISNTNQSINQTCSLSQFSTHYFIKWDLLLTSVSWPRHQVDYQNSPYLTTFYSPKSIYILLHEDHFSFKHWTFSFPI